jgi:hypothetical protein
MLGMDGAQVGVLKETNQVSLRGLLEGHDGRGLETEISLKVLGNFSDKVLEGQLADKELSGFLVAPNLSNSNSARAIMMWLLNTSCSWGRLVSSLRSQLLSWGLATSGLVSERFTLSRIVV